ncbi:pyrophosphatase PpaX [Shouchella shacheensis]|uniref:pyrophosphatase PpaX n=1 Tax=Shouchella shacheensis TaxID=1649580 RepID=UPI00074046B9|nr:pyrophosphatase PpaX [Shouchella shacheensis]
MTIKTLLFDLDGTLINTNELIIASFLHTLEDYYPRTYSRETVLPFIGPPLKETFATLDPERAEEMMQMYRTHNHLHHDALVTEYEGVYDVLQELHAQGYKMAIVTTKIKKTALMGLALMKLDRFFDVVIGLDDVSSAKPDPEPIHLALERLGARREEAIMVGDNSHDIEAGKNAGVATAAVGWSVKGEAFVRSLNPDHVLEDMTDLYEIVGTRAQ